ncbi:MAG: MFS transporter [Rhodospirillaceae bacterium]|jgi:MFS family permease|nr:MFS transporter [Rhodospirillaceae bacterium]
MTSSANAIARPAKPSEAESSYAWWRLLASLLISTTGGVGMWSVIVVLPTVQEEFGVDRADASIPYAATMLGIMVGSVFVGRWTDRRGIFFPVVVAALVLEAGYVATSMVDSFWQFTLIHGFTIGLLGSSTTFGPLLASITLWFNRRRGLAVAIATSGNYLAGTIWPPLVQHLVDTVGWREAHLWIGLICVVIILPLSLALRRPPPEQTSDLDFSDAAHPSGRARQPFPPRVLQSLLIAAGIACCVAMSMPQVHIVAFCGDLGLGAARGAEMLSLMLALGIVSRLASGWLADKIGPILTLLIGSTMQAVSLLFFLPSDGLLALYAASAVFGLFQGGIVPSYAIIVRQYFPASEAGARVSLVMSATIGGMALGGWLSGLIYDLTLSYTAAFLNGFAWNLLNIAIVLLLLWRSRRQAAVLQPA